MNWDDTLRRIANGEDIQAVLDERSIRERKEFVAYLGGLGRNDLAVEYLSKMHEIDSGVSGARSTWSALTPTQRRSLTEAHEHGSRLDRVGKNYRHQARNQPYRPVYAATIRNLCARDLLAWDGGAFDPEAAAVVTERGRFVLAHGQMDHLK